MARGGLDRTEFVHDRARHSVAVHGQNDFTYRTLGDDAHAAKGIRQRGLHLFYPGNRSDADLRAFCLWLGLSHSRLAGSLRLAAQENGASSEAVSVASSGVCPARRGTVHVRVANCISFVFQARARTNHSKIHQSSGDHKLLADVSVSSSSHTLSVHLWICDSLFFGAKRLLHLCLSVWRFLRSRR